MPDTDERPEEDERPPLFPSWGWMYAAALTFLVLIIAALTIITNRLVEGNL